MPTFVNFSPVNQAESGDSPYADAITHCERYTYYRGGGRVTSTHECTHGIHSQLRNSPIRQEQHRLSGDMYLGDPLGESIPVCSLPKPGLQLTEEEEALKMTVGGTLAGLYLLKNQAIMLEQPAGLITQAARLVPQSMRYGRYNLYMVKQAGDWNSEPLYIFDEWVAYRNGALCLIYDATHGGTKDGNTDFILGPFEFITYGLAILKSASDQGPITEELREFTNWLLTDCFNIYFRGKQYAPWPTLDKLYDQFKNDSSFQQLRQFASDSLGFSIPDGPIDPDQTLDWIM